MGHENLDSFADGFNTAPRVLTALGQEIIRQGGTIDALEFILDDPDVCEKIAAMLVDLQDRANMIRFKVRVDYGLTSEEAIALAKFTSFDPQIMKANFDVAGQSGVEEVELGMIRPLGPASTGEVMKSFASEGFGKSNFRQFLAFAARYPGIQLKHRVVCPGSVGVDPSDNGRKVLPTLSGDKTTRERTLDIEPLEESTWESIDHFLVVLPKVERP